MLRSPCCLISVVQQYLALICFLSALPSPPFPLFAHQTTLNETIMINYRVFAYYIRWQPADYADFRVNYATHMHNPSIELEEQEREEAGPAPAVPVAANAGAPAATATATVQGVLVVTASPAPAALTSRSANPADKGRAGGRRHGGGGGGGGSHKVGSGAGGGASAPSQDRVSKSSRYEKVRTQ